MSPPDASRPRPCPGPLEACMRSFVVLDYGVAQHSMALPCIGCGGRTGLLRWVQDVPGRVDLDGHPFAGHLCRRCDPMSSSYREPST